MTHFVNVLGTADEANAAQSGSVRVQCVFLDSIGFFVIIISHLFLYRHAQTSRLK